MRRKQTANNTVAKLRIAPKEAGTTHDLSLKLLHSAQHVAPPSGPPHPLIVADPALQPNSKENNTGWEFQVPLILTLIVLLNSTAGKTLLSPFLC